MDNKPQLVAPVITSFNFQPGRVLAKKYEVLSKLGQGWEGEVFLVREVYTGIERAVKIFFPQRNPKDKIAVNYAKKLHKLRHCPIVIHYHTQETILYKKHPVKLLVSEYVEGVLLSEFLKNQPGRRLSAFQALHLLHALSAGIESIHAMREYHGDLHTENIIIQRFGLGFDLKLLDFYHRGAPSLENIQTDVIDLIQILYQSIGGKKFYGKQSKTIKNICCGLKHSLIRKKFRTAGQLREYLEMLEWE